MRPAMSAADVRAARCTVRGEFNSWSADLSVVEGLFAKIPSACWRSAKLAETCCKTPNKQRDSLLIEP